MTVGPVAPHRSALAATLTLGTFCGTFSIAVLSALGPFIIEELALTGVQFGALSSVVFVVGAVVSGMVGRRVDRYDGRTLMIGLTGASGLVALAMATAPAYPWLLVATAASGLTVAAANPATNALVSRYRVHGARAWLLGLKQSGQPVSMLISGLILPSIAVAVGWRWSLGVVVACCLVGLLLARLLLPALDGPRPGASRVLPGAGGATPSRGLLVYAGLLGLGMSGVGAYLPVYAFVELGVGAVAAGSTAAMVGLAGIVGRLLWARATERRSRDTPMLAVLAAASLPAMAALLTAAPGRLWLVWLGAVGFGATAHSWNAVASIVILRDAAVRDAGSMSAAIQTTFFAGLTVSPLVVGAVGDATGSYRWAWVLMVAVYLAAAITGRRTSQPLHLA